MEKKIFTFKIPTFVESEGEKTKRKVEAQWPVFLREFLENSKSLVKCTFRCIVACSIPTKEINKGTGTKCGECSTTKVLQEFSPYNQELSLGKNS